MIGFNPQERVSHRGNSQTRSPLGDSNCSSGYICGSELQTSGTLVQHVKILYWVVKCFDSEVSQTTVLQIQTTPIDTVAF